MLSHRTQIQPIPSSYIFFPLPITSIDTVTSLKILIEYAAAEQTQGFGPRCRKLGNWETTSGLPDLSLTTFKPVDGRFDDGRDGGGGKESPADDRDVDDTDDSWVTKQTNLVLQ